MPKPSIDDDDADMESDSSSDEDDEDDNDKSSQPVLQVRALFQTYFVSGCS